MYYSVVILKVGKFLVQILSYRKNVFFYNFYRNIPTLSFTSFHSTHHTHNIITLYTIAIKTITKIKQVI